MGTVGAQWYTWRMETNADQCAQVDVELTATLLACVGPAAEWTYRRSPELSERARWSSQRRSDHWRHQASRLAPLREHWISSRLQTHCPPSSRTHHCCASLLQLRALRHTPWYTNRWRQKRSRIMIIVVLQRVRRGRSLRGRIRRQATLRRRSDAASTCWPWLLCQHSLLARSSPARQISS